MNIVNEETKAIILRALSNFKVPEGKPKITQPQAWPGTTFVLGVDEDDGLALLGA